MFGRHRVAYPPTCAGSPLVPILMRMGILSEVDKGNVALIQAVDVTMEAAKQKCGQWLVCRPGCHGCCLGLFEITPLDARRLALGLKSMESFDPARALRVRRRAGEALAKIRSDFPGNPETGELTDNQAEVDRFFELAGDVPCPALDLATGTCDLYAWRPIRCRTFGPPVDYGDGVIGTCELCFQGASEEEILARASIVDRERLESRLVKLLEAETGSRGMTIVACALSGQLSAS